MAEELTDDELDEIEAHFNMIRRAFDRHLEIGAPGLPPGPSWSDLYAGEKLLAEVRRLQKALHEATRCDTCDGEVRKTCLGWCDYDSPLE